MKRIYLVMICLVAGLMLPMVSDAQDAPAKVKKAYEFTVVKEVPHTAVPNQYRSGTCWSFSGIGLLEAEILRKSGRTVDLSEMFIVREAYSEKASKYVRLHGHLNLAAGGGFNDVTFVMDKYGLVPESAYAGLVIGEEKHTHGEMDDVLKAYTDAVLKNGNKKLTPVWHKGFNALLDTYLGDFPAEFVYEGKKYTPQSFSKEMGLSGSDYVQLTAYNHVPLYQPYVQELPDNWLWSLTYNLSLEEMMETIDQAIENGYAVAWGADVSEKGFSWKNGVAIVPAENVNDLAGTEKERWEALTPAERKKTMFAFEEIVPEKKITPEMRQLSYDNFETTDDHGMLIVGTATDQNGNKYYKVKNSWGTEDHIYQGYFYASLAFVQYKTLNIAVHKEAISKQIRKKIGL
ncbi:MAG: peptidase c1a papain [Bacteroidetes bacterium]|nr:MAG: peptidase c1a papain [Bacteroidota bacterium]